MIQSSSTSIASLRVHAAMEQLPLTTPGTLTEKTGLALGTVLTAIRKLVDGGIVREITGRKRDRIFEYTKYLRLLSEGTEPIRPQRES